jgi:hypothetical protein
MLVKSTASIEHFIWFTEYICYLIEESSNSKIFYAYFEYYDTKCNQASYTYTLDVFMKRKFKK